MALGRECLTLTSACRFSGSCVSWLKSVTARHAVPGRGGARAHVGPEGAMHMTCVCGVVWDREPERRARGTHAEPHIYLVYIYVYIHLAQRTAVSPGEPYVCVQYLYV